MDAALIRISKFLSLVLRHNPGKIGLRLDPNGWADVDELIQKANRFGVHFDRPMLEKVVAENDKKRSPSAPIGAKSAPARDTRSTLIWNWNQFLRPKFSIMAQRNNTRYQFSKKGCCPATASMFIYQKTWRRL